MTSLKTILADAATAGVIAPDQTDPLESFLSSRNVVVSVETGSALQVSAVTDTLVAEDPAFETEAPRFIRGFHDVLITIGALVLLAGVWGFATEFAVFPVLVILSEILVRRQRLALPAVVLSLATAVWTLWMAQMLLEMPDGSSDVTALLLVLVPLPPVMGLYYWRYRVPIGLAILLISVFSALLVAFLYALGAIVGVPNFIQAFPFWSALIFLASAIALFGVALYFDLSDPTRQTRRSDIAFWLHLASAPALLYAMMSFIFLREGSSLFSLDSVKATESALLVLAVVAVLMTIGLVLDRRAFVTAGLVSLITAVVTILGQSEFGGGGVVFLAMLLVGLMVLSIGIGWPRLRHLVFSRLPQSLRTKLPSLR